MQELKRALGSGPVLFGVAFGAALFFVNAKGQFLDPLVVGFFGLIQSEKR